MDRKYLHGQDRRNQQTQRPNLPSSSLNSNTFFYPESYSPSALSLQERSLIRPNTAFARAVIMGNDSSSMEKPIDGPPREPVHVVSGGQVSKDKPMSNLSVLMNQQQEQQRRNKAPTAVPSRMIPIKKAAVHDEADSASGPPSSRQLGSSAPSVFLRPGALQRTSVQVGPHLVAPFLARGSSSGAVGVVGTPPTGELAEKVRRCLSSKELGTLAPPSGSPYANMLAKKEELETSMRLRLRSLRESAPDASRRSSSASNEPLEEQSSSTSGSSRRKEGANEQRNRRRAAHNQAVVNDLCEVVADLFSAESKLLKPTTYGVSGHSSSQRDQVLKSIQNFVSALPSRYALGADTPSEVLLHMRLMAAARSDSNKAVVHIHSLEDDSCNWSRTAVASSQKHHRLLRLVTISCNDAVGLLEYITKLLGTGGSRVLDADVMLSTDGIVLDRFVVEMNGRLRLDMVANLLEAFLKEVNANDKSDDKASSASSEGEASPVSASEPKGPLYYHLPKRRASDLQHSRSIREEMESAVPLTEVLASSHSSGILHEPYLPKLRKMHSMPTVVPMPATSPDLPNIRLPMRPDRDGAVITLTPELPSSVGSSHALTGRSERRTLLNRPAISDLGRYETEDVAEYDRSAAQNEHKRDYFTVPKLEAEAGAILEDRVIPLVPFDELMLIETLGSGRVSTIYRAAWQRPSLGRDVGAPAGVQILALKVAMVNAMNGDRSHVDELRREADIAARLAHPNICDLVGVAADSECFCLAYDYCEGGSLLSLLTDTSRYYEYLPVALDIANGMAYLHSRQIIHRDLKPSNILLTRDHRAKIADFGMSVTNAGQELTGETGTYRYMAPEVIRHESYSSNADVYSFGICLWQVITREIPFATMTPIQAAYAVAEGRRPPIPPSTPRRLQEIIVACWDQDSHKRPSFTYIAMALADYAKMAFSPANVGALTLQIANEMLANVEGNSTVNVDFTTPVDSAPPGAFVGGMSAHDSMHSNVGLEIE